MKTYSFETKDGFRVDADGSYPLAAFNKLKKIGYKDLTGRYFKYDKDGFHSNDLGWDGGNIFEQGGRV